MTAPPLTCPVAQVDPLPEAAKMPAHTRDSSEDIAPLCAAVDQSLWTLNGAVRIGDRAR